jgi:outer membrane protein assembly factor BamD
MFQKFLIILLLTISLISCSKKNEVEYEPSLKIDPYNVYKEGIEAFEEGNYFYAEKKFSEAELNFEIVEFAAKAAIMASYALYGINFYTEALTNLERFIKKYPADKNILYAHYLIAIIYYEQIKDEKKDLLPLIKADEKINTFLKEFPESDYAFDLRFKKDLIQNQLAAKELFIAKYYISTQKWVAAINRLKVIVNKYDKTVFIEEALHRLVEVNYYLGLDQEAKKYANILGYNYNSGEWFERSYKILNKDYKIVNKIDSKNDKSLLKKILKKIK